MFIGLLHIHSLLRWIFLFLLVASVVKSFAGMSGKMVFTEGDRKRTLFTLILAHIQILIGIVIYLISPNVKEAMRDMAATMKDSVARFLVVEHLSMMVLAVILITVGYVKAKKATEASAKYKVIAIWFTIALVLIIAAVPWPCRSVGVGRNWF